MFYLAGDNSLSTDLDILLNNLKRHTHNAGFSIAVMHDSPGADDSRYYVIADDLPPGTSPVGVRVLPSPQKQPVGHSPSCYAGDDDCTLVATVR